MQRCQGDCDVPVWLWVNNILERVAETVAPRTTRLNAFVVTVMWQEAIERNSQ